MQNNTIEVAKYILKNGLANAVENFLEAFVVGEKVAIDELV